MDGLQSEGSMPASVEPASTPSEATPSTSVQPEAAAAVATATIPAAANLAQPEAMQAAESDPAAPVERELPDDEAFSALTGPERGQNWKQARARIAELNQQVQGFSTHRSAIEGIESLGGWERVQQQAELGALLFSQIEDPNTGQIQLTAEPLIERLASESPGTLGEIVWKGIHQPSPWYEGETLLDTIVREQLGLDPRLLDTYKQIQNPADAQKYMQPGQVGAEELAAVDPKFHDAYKSLTPKQREELSYADEETKSAFLQDKADALQARQFMKQQEADREQQRQQATQAFQERIDQRGQEIVASVRDAALSAARTKLQAEAIFSTDKDVNDGIHEESIRWAAQQLQKDAGMSQDNDRADRLYRLSAEAELRGDKMHANQYRVTADALTTKIKGRFLNKLTERTAFWSRVLGASRTAQQQQVEQARPRAEIGSNNQPLRTTQTVGNGSFEPSQQRLEQYRQIYKATQMQNG